MKSAALLAMTLSCAGCGTALAGEESIRLTDGPGREATSSSCAICHSLDYIPMNGPVMNRGSWEKTLQKMIGRFGAPIDDAAAREILDYLSANYAAGGR
jgi:sulfite dehydrogenase (cytochrome) subunit B